MLYSTQGTIELSKFFAARFNRSGFSLMAETVYSDREENLVWGVFNKTDECYSIIENELVNQKTRTDIRLRGAKEFNGYQQNLQRQQVYKISVTAKIPDIFVPNGVGSYRIGIEVTARCESIIKPSWDNLKAFFTVVDCSVSGSLPPANLGVIDFSKISKVLEDLIEHDLSYRNSTSHSKAGFGTEDFVFASYSYAMDFLDNAQLGEIYGLVNAIEPNHNSASSIKSTLQQYVQFSEHHQQDPGRQRFLATLLLI